MRHDRGADDAERQIEHGRIVDDLGRRREAADHLAPVRVGQRDLDEEAQEDHAQQRDDEGLDPAESEALQPQDQEHVQRGDQHAELQRDAEQQVEADGSSHHLGDVGGDDGDFGEEPEDPGHRAREGIAAGLRQVPARSDRQPRAKGLQDDGHDVGHQRHGEQRIAELGAAGDGGGPVAGVHVAHRHQEARAHEGQRPAEHRAALGDAHGAEHVDQRRLAPAAAPARFLRQFGGDAHAVGHLPKFSIG